ncbi:hypothetical protein DFP97_101201 [Paenibacillus prosopidis]|uniref:Uncharacterized protein n=1 Tax=Paenibacillus prosopidis TaxID=630520 RepID=A0A368WAW2_9BACL|nr:hypothetical protein DFP97_101201 [Paenibacillus prosopidis]
MHLILPNAGRWGDCGAVMHLILPNAGRWGDCGAFLHLNLPVGALSAKYRLMRLSCKCVKTVCVNSCLLCNNGAFSGLNNFLVIKH